MRLGRAKKTSIDAAAESSDGAEIVTTLAHSEPWEGSNTKWKRLEDRLNACVDLILADYAARPRTRIDLCLMEEPTVRAEALRTTRRSCAGHGIELQVQTWPGEPSRIPAS